MFFNNDILFKPGPVALMWKAGTGEIKTKDLLKNKRNKHFIAIIEANIFEYFPRDVLCLIFSYLNPMMLFKARMVLCNTLMKIYQS